MSSAGAENQAGRDTARAYFFTKDAQTIAPAGCQTNHQIRDGFGLRSSANRSLTTLANKERKMATRVLPHVNPGDRFGFLIALSSYRQSGRLYWKCLCDCGGEKAVRKDHLYLGLIRSCGCQSSAMRKSALATRVFARRGRLPTHGCAGRKTPHTPEYRSWAAMRTRCLNPNDKGYKNYGGRGIQICERWNDFAAFLADMGTRPTPDHTIERRDNNGNYEPDNVCWATRKVQNRNTRSNRLITHNDRTLCLTDWAEDLGIVTVQTLHRRLKDGWDFELALTTPPIPNSAPRPRTAAGRWGREK